MRRARATFKRYVRKSIHRHPFTASHRGDVFICVWISSEKNRFYVASRRRWISRRLESDAIKKTYLVHIYPNDVRFSMLIITHPQTLERKKKIAHPLNESSWHVYWLVAPEQLVHTDNSLHTSLIPIFQSLLEKKNTEAMYLPWTVNMQSLFCCPAKVDYILIVHNQKTASVTEQIHFWQIQRCHGGIHVAMRCRDHDLVGGEAKRKRKTTRLD